MTSNADAIRQLFAPQIGPVDVGRTNLPAFGTVYPDYQAPIIAVHDGGCKLWLMQWGWPPFGQIKRPITDASTPQPGFFG